MAQIRQHRNAKLTLAARQPTAATPRLRNRCGSPW